MKEIWSYINLFFASMGITLILLIFYSSIDVFVNVHLSGILEYYKTLVDKLSYPIFGLNFFIFSTIFFIILLIINNGKSSFDIKK